MNPNVAVAPAPQARILHDVVPPYADAMPKPAPAAVQLAQPVQQPVAQSLPVQPTQSMPAPSAMFPVHTQAGQPPAKPAPIEAEHIAPQPVQPQEVKIEKAKTNWFVILLAIVVSAALAGAAYMAFSTS